MSELSSANKEKKAMPNHQCQILNKGSSFLDFYSFQLIQNIPHPLFLVKSLSFRQVIRNIIYREHINIYTKDKRTAFLVFFYNSSCILNLGKRINIIWINKHICNLINLITIRPNKPVIIFSWHHDVNIIIPRYITFMTDSPKQGSKC